MSDENGQEIGVNVYDDNEDDLIEDEEAATVAPQPVGVAQHRKMEEEYKKQGKIVNIDIPVVLS